MESEHEIPIWFFVGILLLVYGVLIGGMGVYHLIAPPAPEHRVQLFELHADFWWGGLMAIVGAFYCVRFRPAGPHAP